MLDVNPYVLIRISVIYICSTFGETTTLLGEYRRLPSPVQSCEVHALRRFKNTQVIACSLSLSVSEAVTPLFTQGYGSRAPALQSYVKTMSIRKHLTDPVEYTLQLGGAACDFESERRGHSRESSVLVA